MERRQGRNRNRRAAQIAVRALTPEEQQWDEDNPDMMAEAELHVLQHPAGTRRTIGNAQQARATTANQLQDGIAWQQLQIRVLAGMVFSLCIVVLVMTLLMIWLYNGSDHLRVQIKDLKDALKAANDEIEHLRNLLKAANDEIEHLRNALKAANDEIEHLRNYPSCPPGLARL